MSAENYLTSLWKESIIGYYMKYFYGEYKPLLSPALTKVYSFYFSPIEN